jgi:hypothetical protein
MIAGRGLAQSRVPPIPQVAEVAGAKAPVLLPLAETVRGMRNV